MAKIRYSAKLASGHIVTRNSDRTYTHFWRVSGRAPSNGFSGHDAGFTSSLELANKAVSSTISRLRKHAGSDVQFETEIVAADIEDQKPGHSLASRLDRSNSHAT